MNGNIIQRHTLHTLVTSRARLNKHENITHSRINITAMHAQTADEFGRSLLYVTISLKGLLTQRASVQQRE